MYTLCLPLTGSDECVHVVGQYVKSFASTPKLGWGGGGRGGGGGGEGRKGKGICAVTVSPINENRKRSSAVQPNISQI